MYLALTRMTSTRASGSFSWPMMPTRRCDKTSAKLDTYSTLKKKSRINPRTLEISQINPSRRHRKSQSNVIPDYSEWAATRVTVGSSTILNNLCKTNFEGPHVPIVASRARLLKITISRKIVWTIATKTKIRRGLKMACS